VNTTKKQQKRFDSKNVNELMKNIYRGMKVDAIPDKKLVMNKEQIEAQHYIK